jgi:hypothetical protein
MCKPQYATLDNGELFCADYASFEAALSDASQLGEGFTVVQLDDAGKIVAKWNREGLLILSRA